MSQDPNTLINELLIQNKELRLKMAVLSARKRLLEQVHSSLNNPKMALTPELVSQLSPEALHALQNMEIK